MIHPLDAAASLGRGTIGVVRSTGAVAMFGAAGLLLHNIPHIVTRLTP